MTPTNTSNPTRIDPAIREKIAHRIADAIWTASGTIERGEANRRGAIEADAILALTPSDGWQDISTAPKDGTWVLLYAPEQRALIAGAVVAGLCSGGDWFDAHGYYVRPTHWRPLPPPPRENSNLKSEGGDA